jgi:predicted  nucleic acid-binding Zn-ribbon protein
MSYGSQSSSRGSRRGRGRGRRKLHHEKKRKEHKHRSGGKYLLETDEAPSFEEVAEKTIGRLGHLAGQTFACSPFSQYYDDWLLSLKSVLSEFESNPAVEVDEAFVMARSQVIADVELKLSQRQREDAAFEETTRMLAENKMLLVQTDTEYSYATQELAAERKSEIKRLTSRVRDLEAELEEIRQTKVSVFSPLARRSRSKKKAKLNGELDTAKSELDSEVKALEAEQEKLRIGYEEKKKAITKQVQSLEKKVSGAETDSSVEDRQFACDELINVVKALLQRKKSLQQNEPRE